MDDLIARLEKATGPDRELDAAINAAVLRGWPIEFRNDRAWAFFHHADDDEARWHYMFEAESATCAVGYPRCTASIDAALALLPDGMFWSIEQAGPYADGRPSNPRARLWALVQTDFGPGAGLRQDVTGKTPAIAIAIAALKARKAGSEGERDG